MAAIDRMLCQAAEHFLYIGTEEIFMSVSYKKLWKLLIDKDMKKKGTCVKRQVLAQHLSPRWDGMVMSPRRYS